MNHTLFPKAAFLSCAAFAVPLIASAAWAQDQTAPPPTLENFSLPPGQNQVQPAPPPVVVPTIPQNQIAPAPTLTPAPTPAPPPRSAPTPTPSPAPAQQPSAQPDEQATPDTVEPGLPGNETATPILPPPADIAEPPPAEPVTADAGWTGWIVAGLALLAAIGGLLFWRRRRAADQDFYEETEQPVVAEQTPPPAVPPMADPVALAEERAAPIDQAAADQTVPVADTVMVQAEPQDVAAATIPAAPQDDRPWLEFALRPVKAGVNVMDAVVEFELTVGNAGSVAAEDVRIAAWLISASPNQDVEIVRFLESTPPEAIMAPIEIAPGDGKRIDAAIALPRTGVNVVTVRNRPFFVPLVLIDARYALPGGGEGRSSAAMVIGTVREGHDKLGPIWLDRGVQMHTNVEARLHGEPRRS